MSIDEVLKDGGDAMKANPILNPRAAVSSLCGNTKHTENSISKMVLQLLRFCVEAPWTAIGPLAMSPRSQQHTRL
jgi:hypothetical protein